MTHRFARRVVSVTLAVALPLAGMHAANASPGDSTTSPSSVTLGSATAPDDRAVDDAIRLLDRLPEDIKQQDPSTPGYTDRLTREINALEHSGAPGIAPYTNWATCAAAIGLFIAQYDVPIAKVISWLKKAKALYGSIRGILEAIRRHEATAAIGEDAAHVLEGLLGTPEVANACQ
ncbi:hypothetical protein [Corynebacterium bovis]|uniref:hypothetical protein n=1 Tax=Corynebacterium bovis TaxID=36808 RepID=UPI000F64B387|nr:hypothetical protein [Corynebacterium bovis]